MQRAKLIEELRRRGAGGYLDYEVETMKPAELREALKIFIEEVELYAMKGSELRVELNKLHASGEFGPGKRRANLEDAPPSSRSSRSKASKSAPSSSRNKDTKGSGSDAL